MSSVNFKSMTMRAIPRVVISPLYTSASSPKLLFFDVPPPPPPPQYHHSRQPNTPNLRVLELTEAQSHSQSHSQGKGEGSQSSSSSSSSSSNGPSASLALTYNSTPASLSSSSLSSSPYASFLPNSPSSSAPSSSRAEGTTRSASRERTRQSKDCSSRKSRAKYQLDVGAYGIPKRCRPIHTSSYDPNSSLSVGVGEDAYFVRNNAMGVADGVGGWSRKCRSSTPAASPSALFARHLMHFCSAELEAATTSTYPPRPYPTTTTTETTKEQVPLYSSSRNPPPSSILSAASGFGPCVPYTPFSPPPPPSTSPQTQIDLDPGISEIYPPYESYADVDLEDQLTDELEELEDGIDVLMILERAYQQTLGAHVVTEDPKPERLFSSPLTSPFPPPLPPPALEASTCRYPPPDQSHSNTTTVPLLSGSSTVLLAVLDHVPKAWKEDENSESNSEPSSSDEAQETNTETEYEAVVKVAHVGDCMGMLIRGEQVVWRSEEMWWSFNTPVQLGPSSPATPSTSAHVFTLPVQQGDVLILASDGLSDNLWDEDVVDVIKGVRKSFSSVSPEPDTKVLAAQLSEALCSRARRVSERRGNSVVVGRMEAMRRLGVIPKDEDVDISDKAASMKSTIAQAAAGAFKSQVQADKVEIEDEVPFARRAREAGRVFRGGKTDDISVIVAVISPVSEGSVPATAKVSEEEEVQGVGR